MQTESSVMGLVAAAEGLAAAARGLVAEVAVVVSFCWWAKRASHCLSVAGFPPVAVLAVAVHLALGVDEVVLALTVDKQVAGVVMGVTAGTAVSVASVESMSSVVSSSTKARSSPASQTKLSVALCETKGDSL